MIRALIVFLVMVAGTIPRVRRVAVANLRIAFGPSGTGIYFKSLFRIADNICAVLKACRKNPTRRPQIRLDTAMLADIGVPPPYVCVTGHLGPFELLARFSEVLQGGLAVIARPPKSRLFKLVLAFIRRRLGIEVIDKQDAMRASIRSMSAGKSVAIFADHNAGYHGTFLPFLGFLASTSRLPAVLAMRFNKPIVMGFIRKDGPEFVMWVEKVIVPNGRADAEMEERRILGEMNAVYTDVIRRYPDEWFWFHRRWKTRPGDREAHILR